MAMRVLVTGGTGVVGGAAVTALLAHGHTVRLLSRNAVRDARQWPEGVEAHPGDVGDPATVVGAAAGCEAVLHIVGIVEEAPPAVTFERVNVGGTRAMVQEAERAGARRFVFVSSLGAERGASEYHRSKTRAEDIVRTFKGEWVICRPGSVYGPGDEQVSLILKMVRTTPVIPLLGSGDHPFQPVWADDLGEALAQTVERSDLAGRALDMAGPEQTTQNDLIARFSRITDRSPMRVPVPEFVASLGTRVAGMLGIDTPLNDNQLTMIQEGSVIRPGQENALETEFDLVLTPLDTGLRKLADVQPELLPREGVGSLERKRFWADITGSAYGPDELFERFRVGFARLLPLDVAAEPGTPTTLEEGATITMALPLRGHVQVRVAEAAERRVTLLTVEGHPLAGAVRFLFEWRGEAVRFEVQVYERAATVVDFVVMRTLGAIVQNVNWAQVVERVAEDSRGRMADGVQSETATLGEEEAEQIERWVEALVMQLKRTENEARTGGREAAADIPVAREPADAERPEATRRPGSGEIDIGAGI
jgi:NADH dehydrogenase